MERFENIRITEHLLLQKRQLAIETQNVDVIRFVRIAILTDSTINELVEFVKIFLKLKGIESSFWLGDFNKIVEDAIFRIDEIIDFNPDIIIVHETGLIEFAENFEKWSEAHIQIWESLRKCGCQIVQTNLPLPLNRPLQNCDSYHPNGGTNRNLRMNSWLSERIYENSYLHLLDLNYISSQVGLKYWYDERLWFMYGCAYSQKVVPMVAYRLTKLLLSVFGFNHKLIVLDMDNTLWGGVWADDGAEGVQLGGETSLGRAYSQFQNYICQLKKSGMLLAVCSKNDINLVKDCFSHPGSKLTRDDFVCLKVNWNSKVDNIEEIVRELNIGIESVIFLDDNPVERHQVLTELPQVWVPEINSVEEYIEVLESGLIFDKRTITDEDKNRTRFYQENVKRQEAICKFVDRRDYLQTLGMKLYLVSSLNNLERIVQLINKTNQFQVTGKRGTENGILNYIQKNVLIAARLSDIFGDNGIISVLGISIDDRVATIDYWVMSCRVFQRDVEYALFCYVVKKYVVGKADVIRLKYCRTEKNRKLEKMITKLGFSEIKCELEYDLFEMKVSDFSDFEISYIEVVDNE